MLFTVFFCVYNGQIPPVDSVIGGVPNGTFSDNTGPMNGSGKLRIKMENLKICDTPHNVYQAAGYGDLTKNDSLWFWFIASQNNSHSAPVVLWLNGGPGLPSMIGLFQEQGLCRISNDSKTVSRNPYSWNTKANMLYLDQPAGVGFSLGNKPVNNSKAAAADMWTFLQMFFSNKRFCKYVNNTFAIWGESFAGRYIPDLSALVLSQNAAIDARKITGFKLNLQSIGIGNGLTNPLIQYYSYITYAANNPYHPEGLVSKAVIDAANNSWIQPGGCKDQITECYVTGDNQACISARDFCNKTIVPLNGIWNRFYVLEKDPVRYPPDFVVYINSIRERIGAEKTFDLVNFSVYYKFAADIVRNSTAELEIVINAGVRTCFYSGDADYIVNYQAVEAMLDNLNSRLSKEYREKPFSPYTVDGQDVGLFKNVDTLSYVRIAGAGHEVPAYTSGTLAIGQTALQFFSQIIANQQLTPT